MRTLVLILTALALVTFLPSPAAAQQQGSLTMQLTAPEVLRPDTTVVVSGIATLTVDVTAMLAPGGIPVTYSVSAQPAWATVVISPASDVFHASMMVPNGASYQITRSFTMSISVADGPGYDAIEVVEMFAMTTPTTLGNSIAGMATTAVTFDAPEEEEACDHGLTDAQIAALTGEAVEAYNQYNAAKDADSADSSDGDLTVQNTSASPVPIASLAVGAFAIIGAGVGLLLRKRLR